MGRSSERARSEAVGDVAAPALGNTLRSAYRLGVMFRTLRAIVVFFAIALGLTIQGVGAPAMAFSASAGAMSECQHLPGQLAHPACPMPSGGPATMGASCQPHCVTPTVLPAPTLTAAPVVWVDQAFTVTPMALPSGLARAPDPFPPRV